MYQNNLQKVGKSGWQSDERSAGVKDGTSGLELSSLATESDGVKVDLPVSLAAERELDHVTGVVGLVDTTEDSLRLSALFVGVAQVEREDGLIEKALLNGGVEWRRDAVDTNGIIAETQDAVKAAKGKGKTWLRGGLTKELVLDLQITNLYSVLRNVTLNATRSVSDGKIGAVLLVAVGVAVIVLAVEVAGDGSTVGRWDPEIGATSVQNDLELLRWVADGNLGEVLRIQEVVNRDKVAILGVIRLLLEHLLGVAVRANAHVLLTQTADVVGDVGALL